MKKAILVILLMGCPSPGSQGPKGDKGDVGAQGPKGDKGGTGATGPKGDAGVQGPKGDKGDVGTQGVQGIKGDTGDNNIKSGTRIKVRMLVGTDGLHVPTPNYWDIQRNEECWFNLASDGEMRCLPSAGGASSGFYSDSACSKDLFLSLNSCVKYGVTYVDTHTCSTNHYTQALFTLSPVNKPTVVYTKSTSGSVTICNRYDVSTDSFPGYTWYQPGAIIDPASFAKAVYINE